MRALSNKALGQKPLPKPVIRGQSGVQAGNPQPVTTRTPDVETITTVISLNQYIQPPDDRFRINSVQAAAGLFNTNPAYLAWLVEQQKNR